MLYDAAYSISIQWASRWSRIHLFEFPGPNGYLSLFDLEEPGILRICLGGGQMGLPSNTTTCKEHCMAAKQIQ